MIHYFTVGQISSLSSTEMDTLQYISKNQVEVLSMSIQELAKNTFVSTTTIIRLCKKLDLDGFAHLKYFIKDIQSRAKFDKEEQNFDEMLKNEIFDVVATAESINSKKLEEIIDHMTNKNVHFFAKGLTNIFCDYAVRYLLTVGKYAIKYDDTHIAYIQAGNMTDNDIVFLASMSGHTHQVLRVAQIAKSNGATIVTFTGDLDSPIAQIGNYTFVLSNTSHTNTINDTKSRVQLHFLLNFICKNYANKTL